MKRLLTLTTVLATLAGAAGASAAPIHLIGSARAAGEFAATTASGHAEHPGALYVRGYGRGLSISTAITCSRGIGAGTRSRRIRVAIPGRLYRLALPMLRPDSCEVAASISGRGPIRVQLLAG